MWFSVFPLPILHKHVRVIARRAHLNQLAQRISGWAGQLPTDTALRSWAPCDYCSTSDFSGFQLKSHLHLWTCFLTARSVVTGSRDRQIFHSDIGQNCFKSFPQCSIHSTTWHLHSYSGNFILFYKSMGILWAHTLQTSFLYHTRMTVPNPTLQLCSGNSSFSQPTSYPLSPKKVEHIKVLLRIRAFFLS